MSETKIVKHRIRVRITTVMALLIGVLIGMLVKSPIVNLYKSVKTCVLFEDGSAYDIEEVEVDFLQMLDGVKGVSFDVVNGIRCICKCDDVYPEGESVVYKFQGCISDVTSRRVQKIQFNYTVKPFVANGLLSLSTGYVSQLLLEPEDIIVTRNDMKRLLEAFAVTQFKPLVQNVPNGAFAIKELYSKMVVIQVAKEK